jgi:hypothetical protein
MVNIHLKNNRIILDFKANLACTSCNDGFYTNIEDILSATTVQVTCTVDCSSVDISTVNMPD